MDTNEKPAPNTPEVGNWTVAHFTRRMVDALAALPMDVQASIACSVLASIVVNTETALRQAAQSPEGGLPDADWREAVATYRRSTTESVKRLAALLPVLVAAETQQDFDAAVLLFSDDLATLGRERKAH